MGTCSPVPPLATLVHFQPVANSTFYVIFAGHATAAAGLLANDVAWFTAMAPYFDALTHGSTLIIWAHGWLSLLHYKSTMPKLFRAPASFYVVHQTTDKAGDRNAMHYITSATYDNSSNAIASRSSAVADKPRDALCYLDSKASKRARCRPRCTSYKTSCCFLCWFIMTVHDGELTVSPRLSLYHTLVR